MTNRDIALIGCRLLAIYWLIASIQLLEHFIAGLVTWYGLKEVGDDNAVQQVAFVYYGMLPFLTYLVAALFLWFAARRIANAIIPVSEKPDSESAFNLTGLQTVAFAAVGLFVLLDAVPEFGGILYTKRVFEQMDVTTAVGLNSQLLRASLQMLLGVALLLGARGFSGIVTWVRELGQRSKTSD